MTLKWPILDPFPDPSGGPNPFVRRQTRYHPGVPRAPKMAISLHIPSIGQLVSFSLSRARAKVYIGDPGTGAQDPRRGVRTQGLGSSKHPIWTTFGEVQPRTKGYWARAGCQCAVELTPFGPFWGSEMGCFGVSGGSRGVWTPRSRSDPPDLQIQRSRI